MRDFGENTPVHEERILWLCVLMDKFLNLRDFKYERMLHSGMPSILDAPLLAKAKQALHNLRLLNLGMDTPFGVGKAIDDYLSYHEDRNSTGDYIIQPKTRTFAPASPFDSEQIENIVDYLSNPFPHRLHNIGWADQNKEMAAITKNGGDSETFTLDPIAAKLPDARYHDFEREPAGEINIPIADLFEVAKEMDLADVEFQRERKGNWHSRLSLSVMKQCAKDGLVHTDTLTLQGCKHLIGMPGIGKTSLLMVLAVWLARKGVRLMMIFPTVAVSSQYKSDLTFYGIKAAMLTGQGHLTLKKHRERIAETIAARTSPGGFGGAAEGSGDFAANCMLRAYNRGQQDIWEYGYAPCLDLTQKAPKKRRPQPVLCPLFTACGRKRSVRDLVDANVWVGHIRSMDTALPAYTSALQMQYFEYIARNFDVVIFDEADKVQADLDAISANKIKIVGKDSGLVTKSMGAIAGELNKAVNQRMVHQASQEFNKVSGTVTDGSSTLIASLNKMLRDNTKKNAVSHFDGQLITPQKMLLDIFSGLKESSKEIDENEAQNDRMRRNAIIDLWDNASFLAFKATNKKKQPAWHGAAATAAALGKTQEEITDIYSDLERNLVRYNATHERTEKREIQEDIANILSELYFGGKESPVVMAALEMVVPVTMLTLGYRNLMQVIGRLPIDSSYLDFVENTLSKSLSRYIPESLVGSLTGLKYQIIKAPNGREGDVDIELEYATIKGVPRMYMHSFHRMFASEGQEKAPAVLLVSATSVLEDSPSYHVNCGPHYALTWANPDQDRPDSIWRFRPVPNRGIGQRKRKFLSYSGAGAYRMENLKAMVDFFLEGGKENCELYKDIRSFDVRYGIPRKVALIVNSYEHVRMLKRYIDTCHREFSMSTKAVVSSLLPGESRKDYVLAAAVEEIGDDPNCDILIFPMSALQRGVNVVFTRGERSGDAAMGHLFFLTRPHPTSDDMQFLLGLVGRFGQEFADKQFDANATLEQIHEAYRYARGEQFAQAWRILKEPVMASRLPASLQRAFVADLMVMLLQTIGRGTRGNCSVMVNFVDAAWAPRSAEDEPDTAKTSMLVMMREILEDYMEHDDPLFRELYRHLYQAFLTPLRNVQNLIYSGTRFADDDEDNDPYPDYDDMDDME